MRIYILYSFFCFSWAPAQYALYDDVCLRVSYIFSTSGALSFKPVDCLLDIWCAFLFTAGNTPRNYDIYYTVVRSKR